jgi:hypothetical protein
LIKRTLSSALLYTLAFNLTFFIQELFLVIPKALTPGLHPRLFHNNHTWEGSNPLAGLLQGTGALATSLSGLICLQLLGRRPWHPGTRLFLLWMAYCGLYMALPQVILGAASPRSDVGVAMNYLGLTSLERTAAALVALLLMPLAAWPLARAFLGFADDPAQLASGRARARFVLRIATVPAVLAIALIVPFRVPREAIEVVAVPAVVSVFGMLWVQAAAAWRSAAVNVRGAAAASSAPIALPLAALAALLLVFQLVLRRGISFG